MMSSCVLLSTKKCNALNYVSKDNNFEASEVSSLHNIHYIYIFDIINVPSSGSFAGVGMNLLLPHSLIDVSMLFGVVRMVIMTQR